MYCREAPLVNDANVKQLNAAVGALQLVVPFSANVHSVHISGELPPRKLVFVECGHQSP
jgi:hypothetical protein